MERRWKDLMRNSFDARKFLCVGIDPPGDMTLDEMEKWSYRLVNEVRDFAGFLKPNWAFFMQYGTEGLAVLQGLIEFVHQTYPDLPVILDCKVGDIGNTNEAYAKFLFDQMQADAITIHPYLGGEANKPFLKRSDKGIFVLCHTSNLGADEFQHLTVKEKPLHLQVAEHVDRVWDHNENCGLVAGATYPREIVQIRKVAPMIPILIPGIGKQGGDLKAAIEAGMNSRGVGFIVNISSAIAGADNQRRAGLEYQHDIRTIING